MKLDKRSAADILIVLAILLIAGLIGWGIPTHPRLAAVISAAIGLIIGWFLRRPKS